MKKLMIVLLFGLLCFNLGFVKGVSLNDAYECPDDEWSCLQNAMAKCVSEDTSFEPTMMVNESIRNEIYFIIRGDIRKSFERTFKEWTYLVYEDNDVCKISKFLTEYELDLSDEEKEDLLSFGYTDNEFDTQMDLIEDAKLEEYEECELRDQEEVNYIIYLYQNDYFRGYDRKDINSFDELFLDYENEIFETHNPKCKNKQINPPLHFEKPSNLISGCWEDEDCGESCTNCVNGEEFCVDKLSANAVCGECWFNFDCKDNFACIPATNTCVEKEKCGGENYGDCINPNEYCEIGDSEDSYRYDGGYCAPKLSVGSDCSVERDSCQEDLFCFKGTCTDKVVQDNYEDCSYYEYSQDIAGVDCANCASGNHTCEHIWYFESEFKFVECQTDSSCKEGFMCSDSFACVDKALIFEEVLSFLSPTEVYVGYPTNFTISIDRSLLNEAQDADELMVLFDVTFDDGDSMCEDSLCYFLEDEPNEVLGLDNDDYEISLDFIDEDDVKITINLEADSSESHTTNKLDENDDEDFVLEDEDLNIEIMEIEETWENEIFADEYEWDFGNGDDDDTTTNFVNYAYDEIGTYNLTVNITDSEDNKYSKVFEVEVVSAEDLVDDTLALKIKHYENITKALSTYGAFYKTSLETALKLDEVKTSLDEIKRKKALAVEASDYSILMVELMDLKIPEYVKTKELVKDTSFYFQDRDIDLDALEGIGGGTLGSNKGEYKDAIFYWYNNNFNMKITNRDFYGSSGNSSTSLLRVFEITFDDDGSETPYFIMEDYDDLVFDKDYGEETDSGYVGIELKSSVKKIIFSTTEDLDVNSLSVFVSPSLSDLGVEGRQEYSGSDEGISKWVWFVLLIVLLIVVAGLVYMFLKVWYSKNYEKSLFKNKNDLYNMVSYVQAQKKKGVTNSEISKNLRKSGWSSERVNYVMKKYAGRNIGMPGSRVK
jgi:PKD repeat protein